MDGRLLRLKERHAAAAARDENGLHSRAFQQRSSGSLEHFRIIVDMDAERLLELRFVRRAGRQAAILEQSITRIDQKRDWPPACPPVEHRADGARQTRSDEPRSVVG